MFQAVTAMDCRAQHIYTEQTATKTATKLIQEFCGIPNLIQASTFFEAFRLCSFPGQV
jgi:hypothetical protein